MKTYLVTDGLKIFGPYKDNREVGHRLIACIREALDNREDPTKWRIEETDVELQEEKLKDTPELIPDYNAARKYLGITNVQNTDLSDTNARTLCAIAKLLILAEAWNKADGFVPNWDDKSQLKYCPTFYKEDGQWELYRVIERACVADLVVSSICFKTEKRARQFADKFIVDYRIALK